MKTAVLICPGRGTYNAAELGVLTRHFPDAKLLAGFDAQRAELGQETLSALDTATRFSAARHTRGDNASALIFAASYGDFLSVNRDKIELVAVTGNSMGWYTALACGGALTPRDGFDVVNTMGQLMHDHGAGGQLIYPHMTEDWCPDPARKADLFEVINDIGNRRDHALTLSIDLGGMLVLAGNDAGLAAFETAVPRIDRFPLRLPNHAGFHSALVSPVSDIARTRFQPLMFRQPDIPMIDGRGSIWCPGAVDVHALCDYTFGHQVSQPYDFTRAIAVAAREFAPDYFIVAGPGTTLGGAVAQSLIISEWRGMADKSDFQTLQGSRPFLFSMARAEQRNQVTGAQQGEPS